MKKFIGMCLTVVLLVGIIFETYQIEVEEPKVIMIEEVKSVPDNNYIPEIVLKQIAEKEKTKSQQYEPIVTECKDEDSADYIWEELSKHSPSDEITAGVMGYFWRESGLRSDAVAGWNERNIGRERDICKEFTEIVDAGLHDGSSKDYFIEMVTIYYGGYGLGQWLSLGYLEHFYDFVQEREGSISDAAIQCEFIFASMQQNDELWEMLLECETAAQTGRRIAIWYDGASWEGVNYISTLAHEFYKEYAEWQH